MIDYVVENYVPVLISVFSVLVLLQRIKRPASKALNVPGIVWWFAAWGLGCCAALIAPQDCAEQGWRCWANAASVYGGLAIVLYPISKRITTAIRNKIAPGKPR